jgi:hypothetical protein
VLSTDLVQFYRVRTVEKGPWAIRLSSASHTAAFLTDVLSTAVSLAGVTRKAFPSHTIDGFTKEYSGP